MKVRPQDVPVIYNEAGPAGTVKEPAASRDPQVISPFLVSGGQSRFLYNAGPPEFDPRPDGVQLIAALYVPAGQIGFLKQIRVAPFMPAVFSHPWHGWDGTWPVFKNFAPDDEPTAPGGQMGVWETPFGWEAYYDFAPEPPVPTEWRWHLRIIDGNIDRIKTVRNIGAFNLLNAATWYLQPDIAVPRAAYPQGLPGRAAGAPFGPQRVQVLQGDQLTLHVPIMQDHSLLLFAEWRQEPAPPTARDEKGLIDYTDDEMFYPLLPSFGQLLGYMQIQDREAGYHNALYGWNG